MDSSGQVARARRPRRFAGRHARSLLVVLLGITPSSWARAAGANAEYVLVPGAGHVGAFFADPSAYTGRVRAFLAAALPPEP